MSNPIIGRPDRLAALAEAMGDAPKQEVLGHIATDNPVLAPQPQTASATWTGPSGQIELEDGPPPWEIEDEKYTLSDARRYVDVPTSWTVRWINPRLLESSGGWQNWKPVTAGDPRVKVKVHEMVAPDGNIRRGGATAGPMSDLLAYMPTHWVESRRKLLLKKTMEQTDSAVSKFESVKDEFRRQGFSLDSARHPSHTMAEGNSLRD